MTSIAKEFNVSTSTVCRYCDLLASSKISDTPKMLAIDEFKGNTGGFKYNAIITDPSSKRVIDILKTRDEEYLKTYFKSLKHPENLEYFLQDMWKPFKNFAQSTFKNAKIVADKYHFVRQVIWALERVRKREQRRLSKEERLFFKRSKSLLLKDYKQLSLEEDLYLHNMFSHSYDLEKAYELTKAFKDFQRAKDYQTAKKELLIWIGMAKESKLEEFKDAITALTNWREEICNSKLIKETNGFTEGCNNKIKVLKRNAYGFRNFERFRKRILHIFNKTPHLATSC
jgi:transposase